jgi:hypothetical protein
MLRRLPSSSETVKIYEDQSLYWGCIPDWNSRAVFDVRKLIINATSTTPSSESKKPAS